jgi:hypothetical protein
VIVGALVTAAAVWVIGRIQLANRLAAVPELLPETTLALIEVPDFLRARTQWHGSDLCQIWREPTVQAWLQKPLARLPQDGGGGRQMLEDFLKLGPAHGFVALTSLENNEPKLLKRLPFRQIPGGGADLRRATKDGMAPQERRSETRDDRLRAAPDRDGERFAFRLRECFDNHYFLWRMIWRRSRRSSTGWIIEGRKRLRPGNAAFIDATRHLPNDYAALLF